MEGVRLKGRTVVEREKVVVKKARSTHISRASLVELRGCKE